jgi:hypothetical protein
LAAYQVKPTQTATADNLIPKKISICELRITICRTVVELKLLKTPLIKTIEIIQILLSIRGGLLSIKNA